MKVAIHQPNYLPWAGYFAKMAAADLFILLDDVQFVRDSFIHRVRVAPNRWLTLPVVRAREEKRVAQAINMVQLRDPDFVKSHEGILLAAYGRAPVVGELFEFLRSRDWSDMLTVNLACIDFLRVRLGVTTPMALASDFSVQTTATQRLIDLVKAVGAHTYVSGKGASAYQDLDLFRANGVAVEYWSETLPGMETVLPLAGGRTVLEDLIRGNAADLRAAMRVL